MTKTKRCPKGHRRNPNTKNCDKKAVSMKNRRSLPPTPSSNVYRDTSKLVPADYDYANDPVLWSPASKTRKRCPKGHRRNPHTHNCDKKLKSKKVSSSSQSEMSMPELEDITMMKSPSVHSLSPVRVKSMSLFSQGNSPMTQKSQHYSDSPVEMVSSLNRPSPLFQPTTPDYPPPHYKEPSPSASNEIYVKGVDYYKTQIEKTHLCKVNAKTGAIKYPIGKNNACVGLKDGWTKESMIYFLKNVYDKIPNNVSKEQLIDVFDTHLRMIVEENPALKKRPFPDIEIIEDWLWFDQQLENKFATIGKTKLFKKSKEKLEFIGLVRKGVRELFINHSSPSYMVDESPYSS
jgi:hypothetical protein